MLDVVGQNYRENELVAAHADKPTRRIVGTENGMGRNNWLPVRDDPAYAGMFLWTGSDYLGEADRVGWPRIASGSGLVDRIDNPRPRGYERAAWWSEAPVVHIARRLMELPDSSDVPVMTNVATPAPTGPMVLADWTPADLSPHQETLEVYSNAEEVELIVNDHSLGRKLRNADDAPRQWQVVFKPGAVRAIAYNHGNAVAEETLRTAGKAQRIKLIRAAALAGRHGQEVGIPHRHHPN